MPAANAKTLKRRIKSVGNTRKITKAMELVAASKMKRAVSSVLGTRPYAQLAWRTINNIVKNVDENYSHVLLKENNKAEKTLVILFTSDRGLAGAFNVNILKMVLAKIKTIEGVEVIAVGKRGERILNRDKIPVIASFEGLSNKPIFNDTVPISKMIIDGYTEGKYKKVFLAFTDFVSAISQNPNIIELLPLGIEKKIEGLGEVGEKEITEEEKNDNEYIFEPSAEEVLDKMIPRLIETMVYQALLESTASEHSARMMAMRNATDAAGDMLQELKFTYNQIRQAGITQEIAEISSGKAALE